MSTSNGTRATGSRIDELWHRALGTPRRRRTAAWGAPALVTALAATLRLVHLGHPGELVFDETYYVKDAYTLMNLGYEARWPEGANDDFNAGDADGYLDRAAFIAHPPLGKWIIAGGIALLGVEDPAGWRLGTAIAGTLLVVLVMLAAQLLFRRIAVTVFAGGMLAISGNAIVMSRVALLDTMLALLALLGVVFVLLDRSWTERRLRERRARDDGTNAPPRHAWGPVLWARPWVVAAGLSFGLASAVKWSGLYFLAVFGVYLVLTDALARRRAGIGFWASSAVLLQGPVTFLLLVPLALAAHIASWAGWFASEDGYYRRWVETNGEPWTGALEWVPYGLQNWWHYQSTMYNFHVGEDSEHPYRTHPLSWLLLVRPTSMFYRDLGDGTAQAILGIANPLIWWAGVAAALFLLYRLVRSRDWRIGLVLTGLAAGYLPWLLYPNRTVFQFYTIAFEPYLVLALAAAAGVVLGSRSDPAPRRMAGLATVGGFSLLAAALSAFFWPMWTAQTIPIWFLRLHYWFPTWI